MRLNLIAAAAAAAGLLLGTVAHADQLADIKKKGELVVGVLGTDEPATFIDPKTRQIVGYEVDLVNPIAKKIGVKPVLKQIGVDVGIRILMFAQARRAGELSLARFMPPTAESGKGTSALEEEADVMLGLFKPLGVWSEDQRKYRPLTKAEQGSFERGDLTAQDILIPNTMGVKVLHHRRNGEYADRIVKLHIERGLVVPHSGRVA